MSDLDSSISLVPQRRITTAGRVRPQTAYEAFTPTKREIPRPRSGIVLLPSDGSREFDWHSFDPTTARFYDSAIVCEQSPALDRSPPTSGEITERYHKRRASALTQSFKNGLLELRSFGRRVSVSIKGRSPQPKQAPQDQDTTPATPSRTVTSPRDAPEPASRSSHRSWTLRSRNPRRRPSLPLLSFQTESRPTTAVNLEARPLRSRGEPDITNFLRGGEEARAAAAAQNEFYNRSRTPPLPPYKATESVSFHDAESGIGINIDPTFRRTSSVFGLPVKAFDPATVLATEMVEHIFSYLDAKTLGRVCLVSKTWRRLCQSAVVWRPVFYRAFAPDVQSRHPTLPGGGVGRGNSCQDFQKLYKVRTLVEKRWQNGEAAAIYLNGHKDSVYCVQFDEKKIVTGSRDHTVRIWDAKTYQCIKKLGPPNNPREAHHVERAPADPHSTVPFFKAETFSPNPPAPTLEHWHAASVLCLQYDDEILVTGSSDFTCLVWSIKDDYRPMFRLIGHLSGVLDVCIDQTRIITCSKDTTIKIWDRRTGKLVKTLLGHRGPVNAVQIRGNLLVSASGDGMSKLWRLEDGVCVKEFASRDRGLACVEFSEDGRSIFAGGNDRVIYEYDAMTGNRIRELRGHGDLVRSLHLDSTNSRIISGSYDHSIKVWDAKQGESTNDGGLKINFEGWTSSWMLAAKSNYRKIVCTSQDSRVVVIDFGYGIDGVDLLET